jgi:hypothetical protein
VYGQAGLAAFVPLSRIVSMDNFDRKIRRFLVDEGYLFPTSDAEIERALKECEMINAHLQAARILFEAGWYIRQFFSITDYSETLTVTNGEDELSINADIFNQMIDSSRKDYEVIHTDEGPFGIEKIFKYCG